MKATAILPVKRFAAAKQRLAVGIDGGRRIALVEAMLGDTLDAIGEARLVESTIVVSCEPRASDLAIAHGASFLPLTEPQDTGHSEAVLEGITWARELGATCALLLPGDCPLLDPRELDRLLTGLPGRFVTVVPDRHGTGTNALALAPPDAIRPAFGEGSCARHVAAAREAGVPYAVEELPSLALDLDTPADVIALTRALESDRGRARRTARALGI